MTKLHVVWIWQEFVVRIKHKYQQSSGVYWMKDRWILVLALSQLTAFKYIEWNNNIKFVFSQLWIWQISVPIKFNYNLRCKFEVDKQKKISAIPHSYMKLETEKEEPATVPLLTTFTFPMPKVNLGFFLCCHNWIISFWSLYRSYFIQRQT